MATSAATGKTRTLTTSRIRELVVDNFVWVIFALLWVSAGVLNQAFYSPENQTNLLTHSVILGLLVLAEAICLITGHFDLSIESTLIFSAVIAGWLMSPHYMASGWMLPPVVVVIMMLGVGAAIGAINGCLIAYVKMNPFITTLAMSIVLSGLSIFLAKGRTLYPLDETFCYLGRGQIAGFPVMIIFLVVVYVIFHVFLTFTPFGRKLYAIGGNRLAARAAGIDDNRVVVGAYILSGFLSATAGWVLAGRLNAVSSNMSSGLLFYAFAAAVMGGVSLNGGEGKVLGMFGGVLLLGAVSNLMNLTHTDPYLITAVTGLIILVAMFIDSLKTRGTRTE